MRISPRNTAPITKHRTRSRCEKTVSHGTTPAAERGRSARTSRAVNGASGSYAARPPTLVLGVLGAPAACFFPRMLGCVPLRRGADVRATLERV
eukprot:scaffold85685_cov66-Phaeocystis_antarctica.AAC.3